MYKVFCESRSITLVNQDSEMSGNGAFPIFKTADFMPPSSALITDWLKGLISFDLIISSEANPYLFFSAWVPSMKQVEAAGGVVKNEKGDILFIYRNQFWDLPKGHVDPGEVHLQTALREVEEETGLNNMHVGMKLPDTWHCYFMKGSWYMKHTCWYEMFYNGDKSPKPQLSEGITQSKWIENAEMPFVLSQSYRSVQEVLGNLLLSSLKHEKI